MCLYVFGNKNGCEMSPHPGKYGSEVIRLRLKIEANVSRPMRPIFLSAPQFTRAWDTAPAPWRIRWGAFAQLCS